MNDSQQPNAAKARDDADLVRLVGYPPQRQPRGARRLYKERGSGTYVEIKVADIVDRPSGRDDLAAGESRIWVRAGATVGLFDDARRMAMTGRPSWPRR